MQVDVSLIYVLHIYLFFDLFFPPKNLQFFPRGEEEMSIMGVKDQQRVKSVIYEKIIANLFWQSFFFSSKIP